MGTVRNPKGMGNFTINDKGKVVYRKSVGYQDSGKRKVLCVTANSKSDAIKKMRKKEKEWEEFRKGNSTSTADTVAELCLKHLNYQIEMGDLKPKSIDRREVTITKHIEPYPIGYMQIDAVRIKDIEEHIKILTDKKLSASSITKVVDVLNAAYKWTCLRGELMNNPVAPIKPTLTKRIQKLEEKTAENADVEVLSEQEREIFLKEALRKDATGEYVNVGALYVVFLLYTGLRAGEFLALRYRDIDFANGFITIEKSRSMARNRTDTGAKYIMVEGDTKNNKARKIQLSAEALAILKEIKNKAKDTSPDQFVCVTKTGRPNTTSNLEKRNEKIMVRAGLPYKGGLHILRRTFATDLYRNSSDKDTLLIAEYIGDLASTTEKYYIAARSKVKIDGVDKTVVMLPTNQKSKKDNEEVSNG